MVEALAPAGSSSPSNPNGTETTPAATDDEARRRPATNTVSGGDGNSEGEGECEPDVKVIVLGDSAVGKSKLMERYLEDDYNPRQLSTYALTLFRKDVKLGDGTEVKVDFWDTAGQERFNSMHPSYYYQAHVCILVFDVTRKQTYKNLKHWYQEVRQYCKNIPCILVANKVDVDYMVTKKNFKFAGQHNLPFFFVSSADGTNVVKVFEEAVCAGLGHKKFGGKDFVSECLELFEDTSFLDKDAPSTGDDDDDKSQGDDDQRPSDGEN